MADKTEISWSDATWNPIIGCTKVSPGCDRCYPIPLSRIREKHPNPKVAAAFAGVVAKTESGLDWSGRVNLLPERLEEPLRWRKPRRIFVNSLSDLFHEAVPDEYIVQVWEVMAATPQHTYQILTKRHARMRSWFRRWPNAVLSNVWLGVSVENQQWADIRIPALLETPAAVHWISAEPLLGGLDLAEWLGPRCRASRAQADRPFLDWVVCGGESGPGARPMHPDWARTLRDQCQQAGVAFHFKQWGAWRPEPIYDTTGRYHVVMPDGRDRGTPWSGWGIDQPDAVTMERVGKGAAGRDLDGREWNEFPQEVGVR